MDLTMEDQSLDRPVGVIVIAMLVFISVLIGIIAGLRGIGLLGMLELRPGGPFVLPVVFIGSTSLVLSLILIGIGVGLIMMKGWAWTGAVTIAVVRMFTDFVFFFTGGLGLGNIGIVAGALGMILNLAIIIYLRSASTKEVFGK
jgi:hypothetical protein